MSSPTLLQDAVTRLRKTTLDLLEYAKVNRDDGIFNDVTLQVDHLSIGANRMVLACCSNYFETMFKSNMMERYEPNITIAGVGGKTADILVDYMYSGRITIDNESVMDILAGADYFQLNEVKQFCFEFLRNRLRCENWYTVQAAAKLYRSDELQKQVNEFISENFNKIVEKSDFKAFTKHDLIAFVSNLNRNQVKESLIYRAIINWIKHNEEERKQEFPDLFQMIDLNSLSYDALQDISSEALVQDNVTCAKSVLSLFSKLMKETNMKKKQSKIITIGGVENSKQVTEIFNCSCIKPQNCPDLPYGVFGHCLLKRNDVLFCIGGRNPTNRTEIYDNVCRMKLNNVSLKWRDVARMNEKRRFLGAAVLNDYLVVAGGWNGQCVLASTEYFSDSSVKWRMGVPMQRRRSEFALVECDNTLFAFGGWDGNKRLSCVERFQFSFSKWEFVAPMLRKRTKLAGVSLNGYIYAIGGQSEKDVNSRQKTVERYDPKLDEWSYVCEMNHVRSGACACVFNDQIFVAGGADVDEELVKNIECYDPSKDKWEIVQFPWKDGIRFGGILAVI